MPVLVTGGAGYIGSHVTYALLDRAETVVVLDDLSTGMRAQVGEDAVFVEGDIADAALVRNLIATHRIDAVLNFAGSIVVPDKGKDGAMNIIDDRTGTTKAGDRRVGSNALAARMSKTISGDIARPCRICKSKVQQAHAHYCAACAYAKGICAMCGHKVNDIVVVVEVAWLSCFDIFVTVSSPFASLLCSCLIRSGTR